MANLFIDTRKYLLHKKIFKGMQDLNTKTDFNNLLYHETPDNGIDFNTDTPRDFGDKVKRVK